MTSRDDMKRAAARATLDELAPEGVIGLGSGSTRFMFLEALGDAVRETREKIVSFGSAKNVIVVDETKLSHRLGEQRLIPIEVLTFGHLAKKAHLARHGEPVLRETGGIPVRTDAGNLLYALSLSLDAYLDQAVFSRPRAFSRGEFRALIFARSAPHPGRGRSGRRARATAALPDRGTQRRVERGTQTTKEMSCD